MSGRCSLTSRPRKPQAGFCCKCALSREHLHRDHIQPTWSGGPNIPENWQWLCANCHEDKTYLERATPEYRAFQSGQMKTRMLSPEARAKISEGVRIANLTRVWTPEAREKCGLASKGKVRSPEVRAKISAGNKGKPKSPAHKEALRAAHLGKPWSALRRSAGGKRL